MTEWRITSRCGARLTPKIADISGGIVRSHHHDDAGTRSHPAWFADAATNGASFCVGVRSGLAAGESIFTGLRARIVVARRRRSRDGSPTGVVVLDARTQQQFVALREARDRTLPMPKLILHALQVNIRGGRLPEPEDNGERYLKFPLDALSGAAWGES